MPEIIDDLREALGVKLVAYIAGVSETRTVREWAEAARRPTPAAEDRLRLAHRIVTLISQSEDEAIVPTWFQGMNPQLGDRSPARVLHEDSFDEAGGRVLAAANAFVGATNRAVAAIVEAEQFERLRADSDELADIRAVDAAWETTEELQETTVPWEGVKRDLGLDEKAQPGQARGNAPLGPGVARSKAADDSEPVSLR